MNLANIHSAKSWFEVLQTTGRSQTAVMSLSPGQASGEMPEAHSGSDQVLLLLEGSLLAEVAGERTEMHEGDVVLILAGTPHRFVNEANQTARTFSVYAPPAYPPGTNERCSGAEP